MLTFLFLIPVETTARAGTGEQLDRNKRREVVEEICQLLDKHHIKPDVAYKCGKRIKSKLRQGAYDRLDQPEDFAMALTEDLRSVEFDWHLRVEAGDPSRFAEVRDLDKKDARKKMEHKFRKGNFGFQKIEILHDVIGYLDLRVFVPTAVAEDTAAAAMKFLASADAIIIDLRKNLGGEGSMVDFLCSYFFKKRTLLSTLETRESKTKTWTRSKVPGDRMCGKPLFILTSRHTASAAEAFAYTLKHHGKAKIIGEQTSGGGHTAFSVRVADMFNVVIPNGRTVHPNTGTGFNGVGVEPDMNVPAEKALTKARAEALKTIMKNETDEEQTNRCKWILEVLEAQLNPHSLDLDQLREYAGNYGPILVELEGDRLFVSPGPGGGRCNVIPLGNDSFVLEGFEYDDRARIVKDGKGKTTQLVIESMDGRVKRFDRTGD